MSSSRSLPVPCSLYSLSATITFSWDIQSLQTSSATACRVLSSVLVVIAIITITITSASDAASGPGRIVEWHAVLDAAEYHIPFMWHVTLAVHQLRLLIVELLVLRDDLPFVLPAALSVVPLTVHCLCVAGTGRHRWLVFCC